MKYVLLLLGLCGCTYKATCAWEWGHGKCQAFELTNFQKKDLIVEEKPMSKKW